MNTTPNTDSALRQAAQAVLDRWNNNPTWSWSSQCPTADLVAALQAAMDGTGEPVSGSEAEIALFEAGYSAGQFDCEFSKDSTGAQAAPPATAREPREIDWQAVGRIIEMQDRLRGIHVPGSSNWAAAIWKAAHGITAARAQQSRPAWRTDGE